MPAPATVTLPLTSPVTAHASTRPGSAMWPAERCGWADCGKPIVEGDPVLVLRGEWMHESCTAAAITAVGADEAWLLLAQHIAANPHGYLPCDVRSVLRNLVRIATRAAAPIPGPDLAEETAAWRRAVVSAQRLADSWTAEAAMLDTPGNGLAAAELHQRADELREALRRAPSLDTTQES